MITLNLDEQEVFDLIMMLHERRNSGDPERDAELCVRIEALLQKLHDAFEPLFAPPAETAAA